MPAFRRFVAVTTNAVNHVYLAPSGCGAQGSDISATIFAAMKCDDEQHLLPNLYGLKAAAAHIAVPRFQPAGSGSKRAASRRDGFTIFCGRPASGGSIAAMKASTSRGGATHKQRTSRRPSTSSWCGPQRAIILVSRAPGALVTARGDDGAAHADSLSGRSRPPRNEMAARRGGSEQLRSRISTRTAPGRCRDGHLVAASALFIGRDMAGAKRRRSACASARRER